MSQCRFSYLASVLDRQPCWSLVTLVCETMSSTRRLDHVHEAAELVSTARYHIAVHLLCIQFFVHLLTVIFVSAIIGD